MQQTSLASPLSFCISMCQWNEWVATSGTLLWHCQMLKRFKGGIVTSNPSQWCLMLKRCLKVEWSLAIHCSDVWCSKRLKVECWCENRLEWHAKMSNSLWLSSKLKPLMTEWATWKLTLCALLAIASLSSCGVLSLSLSFKPGSPCCFIACMHYLHSQTGEIFGVNFCNFSDFKNLISNYRKVKI